MNEFDLESLVKNIRRKALRSRIEGIIYIGIVILIFGVTTLYFIKYSSNIISIQAEGATISNLAISQNANQDSAIDINTIGNIILRLGAVLLAIFIIQIIIGFARYRFKISEFHSANADALILSKGEIDKLIQLSDTLSPKVVFSDMPTEPSSKIIELLKEALSKTK